MSTNKTGNLGLHSWVRSDPFRMNEFNENFNKLDEAVGGNSAALEKKADKTELNSIDSTLQNAIALKADKSVLDTLAGQVAKKAEQSALDTLAGQVAKKAEQTALDAETAAREALAGKVDKKAEQSALDTLSGKVDKKAEQTALDAEAAARKSADDTKAPIASPTFTGTPKAPTASSTSNSTQIATTAFVKTAVNALAGRVGSLETGQLRFKHSTYTGKGLSGEKNPNRLDFDFKPLLVIVHSYGGPNGGFPWIRGQQSGYGYETQSVVLTWEEKAVSWYNNGSEQAQLNLSNVVYYYLAIGIAE